LAFQAYGPFLREWAFSSSDDVALFAGQWGLKSLILSAKIAYLAGLFSLYRASVDFFVNIMVFIPSRV
jgi:hypothetical protein